MFNQYDSSNIFCEVCDETGHTEDYCPKLLALSYRIEAIRQKYKQWSYDIYEQAPQSHSLSENFFEQNEKFEPQKMEFESSSPKALDISSSQPEIDDYEYFNNTMLEIDEFFEKFEKIMEDKDGIRSKDDETSLIHEEDKISFDLSDSTDQSSIQCALYRETFSQPIVIEESHHTDEDGIGSKDDEASWTPHKEQSLVTTGVVADDNLSLIDKKDKISFDLFDSSNQSFKYALYRENFSQPIIIEESLPAEPLKSSIFDKGPIDGFYIYFVPPLILEESHGQPLDEPLKLCIFDKGPIDRFCKYLVSPLMLEESHEYLIEESHERPIDEPLKTSISRANGKRIKKYLVPARARFKRYSLNELLERRKRHNLLRPRAPD